MRVSEYMKLTDKQKGALFSAYRQGVVYMKTHAHTQSTKQSTNE